MMTIIGKLSRFQRSLLMVFADIIIGLMAFMVVMLIHKNLFIITNFIGFMPVITSMILSMLISSYILNINKIVLRGFNLNDLSLLFIYAFISSILLYVSIFFLFTNNSTIEVAIKLGFSRIIIIYLPVLFIGILFFRIFSIYILNRISFKNQTRKKVIIYGAGNAGIQLMRSYEKENSIEFLCFIDENPNLRNAIISGVTIYSRKDFERNILKNQADEVWIAIPSLKVTELEKIIQYLSTFSKKILSLPEINNLRFNSSFKNQLSSANINNFLGRETIDIETDLYFDLYKNKNILITGAGGSIGSELCLQILKLSPKKIILFELNELALYNIEKKINEALTIGDNIEVISCLGSINDKIRLCKILSTYSINIVLHAAAYKHVHLVESNIVEGFKNNVIGTYNLVQSIKDFPIERFILVSSDKAVRPTNIMGATKRITEIIVQREAECNIKTNFTIVRFGNVIGSSGSVIPLFIDQINSGGPVTVTDPDMTRYFMAIPEAAKLILVAGSFGDNGEIFLLDMGDPIKIIDLAKNMIFLSGNKIKLSPDQEEGIEIQIINKRPGEKISEELLIDGKINNTKHKKVMVLDEIKELDFPIDEFISNVEKAIKNQDENLILNLLNDHLKDYKPIK